MPSPKHTGHVPVVMRPVAEQAKHRTTKAPLVVPVPWQRLHTICRVVLVILHLVRRALPLAASDHIADMSVIVQVDSVLCTLFRSTSGRAEIAYIDRNVLTYRKSNPTRRRNYLGGLCVRIKPGPRPNGRRRLPNVNRNRRIGRRTWRPKVTAALLR